VVIFIDTSSLAKRYVEESGSIEVDRFFAPGNTIYIAPTTPIEIRSVLSRRLREKSLEEKTVQLASARLSNASIFVTSDKALASAAELVFAGQIALI